MDILSTEILCALLASLPCLSNPHARQVQQRRHHHYHHDHHHHHHQQQQKQQQQHQKQHSLFKHSRQECHTFSKTNQKLDLPV